MYVMLFITHLMVGKSNSWVINDVNCEEAKTKVFKSFAKCEEFIINNSKEYYVVKYDLHTYDKSNDEAKYKLKQIFN